MPPSSPNKRVRLSEIVPQENTTIQEDSCESDSHMSTHRFSVDSLNGTKDQKKIKIEE